MAKGRMVSKRICIDEKLNSLSTKDRWLYVCILVNLDEYGRFSGNVYEIKMTCVPADSEYTTHSVRKSLYRFNELGLVDWKEDVVTEYPNFEKYQKFNHRRQNSDFPSLQKKPRQKKVVLESTEEFSEFWLSYPKGRKFNKIKMGQTYQQAINNGITHKDVMKALSSQKKKWALLEPHLIPHMSTWLNQCRWEMEDTVSIDTNDKRAQPLICPECGHRFKVDYSPSFNSSNSRCPKCNEYGAVDPITFNLMKGESDAKSKG